jgi:hypothetical protein
MTWTGARVRKETITHRDSLPPSCHSTRLLTETSSNCLDLSSITTTSVFPRMCSVVVLYDDANRDVQKGPEGLNPATAMQKSLATKLIIGKHRVGVLMAHLQWRVRRFTIIQE